MRRALCGNCYDRSRFHLFRRRCLRQRRSATVAFPLGDPVKVLLCTKRDLVGNLMLNQLLPILAPVHQVDVLLANRVRPETDSVAELGWMKAFEQDLPNRLLFPLLDAAPQADTRLLSFRGLSARYSVPIQEHGHIASADLTRAVQEAAPDLIVSFQFGFIFKPEALDVPRLGALNLHSGALPERAGVNPTFWCMKDGDTHSACSLHWIDRGIDTGPIVTVRRMELDYSKSFFVNWLANYANGAEMIAETVMALGEGQTLPAIPQDKANTRYVPKPTSADFEAFRASGRRLIDATDYLDLIGRYLPN